jgi:hypothetical protein
VDDARLARDRAEAALRRVIAYPEGRAFTIVTPDSIPVVDANPDVAVEQALRNSSTMQLNELDNVQTKRGIAVAKANKPVQRVDQCERRLQPDRAATRTGVSEPARQPDAHRGRERAVDAVGRGQGRL